MPTIVPCVTVSTPEDYKASLERVHLFAQRIHVDISDGVFAPIALLDPSQIWWPQEWQVDVHAMVSRPSQYIAQLIALKPSLITLHAETEEDIVPLMQQIKQVGIRAGVALLRSTVPSDVSAAIEQADHVMIFSGDLGKYGGTASMMQLEKVRLVRGINAGVEIGWDGGVSIENAFSLAQGGVDVLNTGGAVQKAADPKAAYEALVAEVNKQGVM
jgi:ribulose-phosphate 3-epimerase